MQSLRDQQPKEDSALKRGAKTAVKRTANKALKKAIKKFGAAAAKAAVKGFMAALKALIVALVSMGGSVLLFIVLAILALLVILAATTMMFSFGGGDLEGDAKDLHNYIQEAAANTIDPTKLEQRPYQVPPELVIAAMQIHEGGSEVSKSTYEVVDEFVEALKPTFVYVDKEGYVESEQTTCRDDVCNTVKKKTPFTVNLFESVQAWDRTLTIENTPHYHDWVETVINRTETVYDPKIDEEGNVVPGEYVPRIIPIVITTKTRAETFVQDKFELGDYTYFDAALSNDPFNYGINDKYMVETLYKMTGKQMFYSEWLDGHSLVGFNGTIVPGSNVPTEFMEHYLAAEKAYGVDWYYLAAIHFVETGFSTHPTMVSSVGAQGHMQFMPCTWIGWSYPGCTGGKGFVNIPDNVFHNPINIQKYGGFGVDGDKNGTASPWEIRDAIFAAANMMNYYKISQDERAAIKKYNHSEEYVNKVIATALSFKEAASYVPAEGSIPNLVPGSFMRPSTGRLTSPYGPRNLTGNFHYGIDIASTEAPPIVAVADGVVTKVHKGCAPWTGSLKSKCGGGWGNYVWVKHTVQGQQYEGVYAHLSTVAVSLNQQVHQGQLLGYMGNSGTSTGIHLHFEIHLGSRIGNANVINPALLIPL